MRDIHSGFYRDTQNSYADPAAVPLYVQRIPDSRSAGLMSPMESFLSLVPRAGTLLDVGSGPGTDVAMLRALGYKASGIDTSPAMVEWARSRYGDHFRIGDVRTVDPEILGTFDGVLCIAVLLHILREDALGALAGLRNLMRDGGALLLVTKQGRRMQWDHQLGNSRPRGVVLYSSRELNGILTKSGFRVRATFRSQSIRSGATEKWLSLVATAA